MSRIRAWIRSICDRDRLDADLDRELSDWVDELAARHEASGVPPKEARRRALIDTGGLQQVKDAVHEARVGARAEAFLLDLRYAWRSARKGI